MALTCREDVKRLQQALGIRADGLFDNDTARAVIAAQQPYACITAGDGQVGPQTWALIVDGTEPCRPGKSAAPMPGWARCGSGATDWALQARDGSVLRRCGSALELVHAGKTRLGAVREIGSSVCADFDENFSAPAGTGTTICVSNPATDDTMQASRAGGQGSAVWMEDVVGRYLNKN
jgi:peptidoglycan hydrolase-like protein with peptidoglycan-binding domain